MPWRFPGVATLTAILLATALASPSEAEKPPEEPADPAMASSPMAADEPEPMAQEVGAAPDAEPAGRETASADAVLDGLEDPALADLAREVLERNPDLAAARQRARAADRVAPQVGSLPDPMAGLTAFLLSPETRTGPQNVMVRLSQRFPWFGKLDLRSRRALYRAAAARAEAESRALDLVTRTRRLTYELAFLDEWREILETDRETLERYEELARTRYAAGIGLGQAVIKIQAEITKDESRLLQIADRRAAVVAELNALRDRPAGAELPAVTLPEVPAGESTALAVEHLKRQAVAARPEIARTEAEISAAETGTELADLERFPDVTVGFTYTQVGERDDQPGRINPPPGNGDDVFGLTASVNLPVWRDRIEAGIEEAMARRSAAESARRAVVAGIERSLGELTERLELTRRQLRLFDEVLLIQAEESLSSAEAAYTAGNLNALDLLDAERVLLDVRTSTARTRADWAIALAKLEGAVGRPVVWTGSEDGSDGPEEPMQDMEEGVAP